MIQGTAPFRGETGQDVINEMKKAIVFSNRFCTYFNKIRKIINWFDQEDFES